MNDLITRDARMAGLGVEQSEHSDACAYFGFIAGLIVGLLVGFAL